MGKWDIYGDFWTLWRPWVICCILANWSIFSTKKSLSFSKAWNCGHMKMTQFVGRVTLHNVWKFLEKVSFLQQYKSSKVCLEKNSSEFQQNKRQKKIFAWKIEMIHFWLICTHSVTVAFSKLKSFADKLELRILTPKKRFLL